MVKILQVFTAPKTHFLYNDVNNQQDGTTFRLLIFLIQPYMFRATFVHPQEHFLTVYTAFGTMRRSAAVSVHCTESCIYCQKVLLRMGEFVARNM